MTARTPDRPSERSERDAVAREARAPLGKNTDSVSTLPKVRSGRRRTWALRDGLRTMAWPRAAKCGRVRVSQLIGVTLVDGRAGFNGIMTCGLAWGCPVCRATIQSERAKEVMATVDWHRSRGGETYLVTLTVRHALGHNLRTMRKGIANAWRKVQAGRAWGEWKQRIGFVGSIRALETTHGGNGWHPHIHVLILAKRATPACVESWRAQLSARWQLAIEATLGREHRPNDAKGCDMRVSRKADYIAKLGLEVAGSSGKRARGGNRSPLEIAEDWTSKWDADDGILWRTYAKQMQGARMLTWSRGLRAAVGLGAERTDEELAALDEQYRPAALIERHVWDALAKVKDGPVRALEAMEQGGIDALDTLLGRLVGFGVRAPP